ncbi:MAG: Cobyric acid synthase [Anaerolineales bacterium]|nr:Cobyric acid synthase [Anaerolineales bacterium]
MPASVLMVQGASSSAGKSLLVAALCRIFARRGVRVAPFKAQNMSNNAAVCPDGAEIGRAQATQAYAAGLDPTADMNPILLKPEADSRSQVVVMGEAWRTLPAGGYYERKSELWSTVTAALDRLRSAYELVIIEGAGSPVELNLRTRDIVNMAVARYAEAPVLLVGDIDRGGIFAQLLGTLWLLESEEQALVKGLVANKFRGDLKLFADGVRILENRGGVPVIGVVPFLHDLAIPEEDAVALEQPAADSSTDSGSRCLRSTAVVDIAVVRLPRIANFDDFDPLAGEPGVQVRYVSSPQALGRPDAVILPGTKSTIADLTWLQEQGLAEAIRRLADNGTAVVGICGGYQMLGRVVRDPDHVESSADEAPGLGLLPAETVFQGEKATHRAQAEVLGGPGWLAKVAGQTVSGYEIHMGQTTGGQRWLEITQRSGSPISLRDGAVTREGRVWGCYLHGLFENATLRRTWLSDLGWRDYGERSSRSLDREVAFDHLADAVDAALDMELLERIVWDT